MPRILRSTAVVAGSVVALRRNGRTVLIEGESHDGVTRSAAAVAAVPDWLGGLRAPV